MENVATLLLVPRKLPKISAHTREVLVVGFDATGRRRGTVGRGISEGHFYAACEALARRGYATEGGYSLTPDGVVLRQQIIDDAKAVRAICRAFAGLHRIATGRFPSNFAGLWNEVGR